MQEAFAWKFTRKKLCIEKICLNRRFSEMFVENYNYIKRSVFYLFPELIASLFLDPAGRQHPAFSELTSGGGLVYAE
jgi:hypothetical protein